MNSRLNTLDSREKQFPSTSSFQLPVSVDPTNWFYYVVKLILWVIFRVGHDLKVTGQEHVPKTGPFIIAANHVSFLDPPMVGVACPRRVVFMARRDLFRHWLLGAFLRSVKVIPLARGEADVHAVRTALQSLRRGDIIGIFPEGGRQLSGTLGTAKRGVGLLATMARVPIVPAYLTGTFQALPPHATRLHRSKIRVAFGPAISYTTSSFVPPDPATTRLVAEQERSTGSRQRQQQLADAVTQQWRLLAQRCVDEGVS